MAPARTHGPILEFTRRHAVLTAGVVATVAAVVLFVALRRPPAHPVVPDTAARQPEQLAWSIPDAAEHGSAEVLNATNRSGLARAVTRLLRARGIDVLTFGNADSASAHTLVLVRRGGRGPGREAVRALGVGEVRDAPDSSRHVDLTIIIGKDFSEPLPLHP